MSKRSVQANPLMTLDFDPFSIEGFETDFFAWESKIKSHLPVHSAAGRVSPKHIDY